MGSRFFYLYVCAGTLALAMLAYQIFAHFHNLNAVAVIINSVPVVVLYYLAYKVYREKNNKEMM